MSDTEMGAVPGSGWDEPDDLDLLLRERLQDPEVAAGYEDAAARAGLLASFVRRRKNSQMSQQAVAAAMSTTQSAISELEGGATDPRLSTLQRYARALGCRLDVDVCDNTGPREAWTGIPHTSYNEQLPMRSVHSMGSADAWTRGPRLWRGNVVLVDFRPSPVPLAEKLSAAQ